MDFSSNASRYNSEKQDSRFASNLNEEYYNSDGFDSRADRNNSNNNSIHPPSYDSQFSSSNNRQFGASPGPSSSSPRGQISSSSTSSRSSSSFLNLNNNPSTLLDPPPPSFQRAPSGRFPYSSFAPMILLSHSTDLSTGFPMVPPPCITGPGAMHPFMTHDVNQEDWIKFLGDVKHAAALTPMDRVVSGVAPLAMGLGIVGGLLVSRGLQQRAKSKKTGPVADLVDAWNHYFFHPRRLNLTLAQGQMIYTGPNGGDMLPPTIYRREDDEYSSSSDSDSDEGRRQRQQYPGGYYPQQQFQPAPGYPSAYPSSAYPTATYPAQPYPVMGAPGMPPTMVASPYQQQMYVQTSSRHARRADRDMRKAERRERKYEKKVMKRERKSIRREERRNRRSGERWRLVVEPWGV